MRFKVELRGDAVVLADLNHSNETDFPVAEIRVVGESTNQNGPYAEDWFLCLCDESGWMEIPVESDGFQAFLEALAGRLGFSPALELVQSPDFESRVLWPASLTTYPLFAYTSKWYKLSTRQQYSGPVWEFLKS